MVPSISPLSSKTVARAAPPLRFRPIVGSIHEIKLSASKYHTAKGLTSSQTMGLRFESKVQSGLVKPFGARYEPSPTISFCDDSGWRQAIPDGIYTHLGSRDKDRRIVIVEIKSQHMPEAWWQLEKLYRPLIQRYSKRFDIYCVEIVKTFDPQMPFPTKVTIIDDLVKWFEYPRPEFGVFVWT